MTNIVVGDTAIGIGVFPDSDAGYSPPPAPTYQFSEHVITAEIDYDSDPNDSIYTHYYGNFVYDNANNVVGGTITASDIAYGGKTLVTFTDQDEPAVDVWSAIKAREPVVGGFVELNGNDSIFSNIYNDTINSRSGNDTVIALDGNDSVDGGEGDDNLNGNRGSDTVHGGNGADQVLGGQGADQVFGDDGDDPMVNGNLGDDTVHGGAGADSVYGGQGDDRLFGDDGDDYLSGDLGSDTLTGGNGADTFHLGSNGGHDYVTDFNAAQGDRVLLDHGASYSVAQAGSDTVITLSTGEQMTLAGVALSSLPSGWIVVS
jgi:Ca2+-binding RTX toxin-like protein